MRSTAISDRTVRALLALEDVDQQDVAQWLGTHPSSVTRRIKGQTRWTADEIAVVAGHLGVPVSVFFMRPAEILRRLGGSAPTPPEGDGGEWAPWDSNPQPAEERNERHLQLARAA